MNNLPVSCILRLVVLLELRVKPPMDTSRGSGTINNTNKNDLNEKNIISLDT